MKKFLSLFAIFSLFLVACEGDQGPPGPPGQDGINVVGQTFEITFDFDDEYSEFVTIPDGIEVLESDIILVYLLESVEDGADVWSPLPQTFYFDDGEVQYNYNHTTFDVNIYLHGRIDLNTLGTAFTDDQTFRMVVVPSDFALDSGVDINSYQAVKTALDLDKKPVMKAQLQK
ncbi:collagen-like protein [Gramella sp. BOM4]|nr:collagen-like protein [Christiangramia bathymodioli]